MAMIGFDAVTVSRMEKNLQNEHFMSRQFSQSERRLIASRSGKRAAETAAATFAAKEALSTALGCGIFKLNLQEISVLRRESGEPYFEFSGLLKEKMESVHLCAQLSLSHENGMAFAMVLLQDDSGLF